MTGFVTVTLKLLVFGSSPWCSAEIPVPGVVPGSTWMCSRTSLGGWFMNQGRATAV